MIPFVRKHRGADYCSPGFRCALFILALSSKPINRLRELKFSQSIRAIKAPIDPKKRLNWAKLLTK
jgi:hypothetical protein